MVEQAQQVVSLQSFLVVALADVQHPVPAIKVGKLQTFLGAAKEKQVEKKARQQPEPRPPHPRSRENKVGRSENLSRAQLAECQNLEIKEI